MKELFFGKYKKGLSRIVPRGSSTLEILIAFAILVLTITAVIGVVFGNQSIAADIQTNNEALYRAQKGLEDSRAASRSSFFSVVSTSSIESAGIVYTKSVSVTDFSQCLKQATSTVQWQQGMRMLRVDIQTLFGDVAGALALGGDCVADPPGTGVTWNNPRRFARDTLSLGKPITIDVLNRVAYLGYDKKPYLAIADTRGAVLDQNNDQDFFVTFSNSFNSDGKALDAINDIDIAALNGRKYAFVATASTTAQFAVLDVTDIRNPVLLATRKLSGVTATDSTAWGWRVYFLDKKLYITARDTAGPEFHVFNVADPANPTEDPAQGGGSKELTTTAYDFVVRGGVAYFAAGSDARGEVLVYDVSNPATITEIAGARTNLPGNQDGKSVFLIGNKLYAGRESVVGGPELYILDAANPATASGGLPVLGTPKEIGGDVLAIQVVGQFCFLVSSKTKEEFQVCNISNPADIMLIKKHDFGNIVAGGIDYGPDFIYATGGATPNFQILYSPI